jgi:hypothetical protein
MAIADIQEFLKLIPAVNKGATACGMDYLRC